MSLIVQCADLLSFFLVTIWMGRGVKKLIDTQKTVYFILILYYLIYVLPVGIDCIITYPSYETWTQFQGFYISYNDPLTRIVYDLWMIVTYLLVDRLGSGRLQICFGKSRINSGYADAKIYTKQVNERKTVSRKLYWVLFFIAVLPVFLVIIKKLPIGILYTPLWLDNGIYNVTGTSLQATYYYLQKLSYVSIVAAFLCLVNGSEKKNYLMKAVLIALIYALTCLEAKRAIYAIVLIMVVAYLLVSAEMKRSTKVIVLLLSISAVVGLLFFTTEYMMEFRHYGINYSPVNTYTQIKMDFMRDDRVKFVIYKALNLEGIVSYPLQSYITQLTAFFPLDLFLPVEGYNKFFTAALLGVERGSVSGWVTTSIFDEALSNMGIFSVVIVPMFLGYISRVTDRASSRVKVITIVAVALLFMLNLGYIMWYIQFCFIVLYLDKKTDMQIRTR